MPNAFGAAFIAVGGMNCAPNTPVCKRNATKPMTAVTSLDALVLNRAKGTCGKRRGRARAPQPAGISFASFQRETRRGAGQSFGFGLERFALVPSFHKTLCNQQSTVILTGVKYLLPWMAVVSIFANTVSLAQSPSEPQSPIVLWPDGAPGALGRDDKDIPTLTAFWPAPEIATGAGMVVCPGGGYAGLAAHEGEGYAHWLSSQGIAAFVLKYRLGSSGYRHPRMLEDAARAMRLVRFHAAEWKLKPDRLGIIGSSAGGHLASTLLTHFDAGKTEDADPIERVSCRPDMGVLCYAVITMGDETHRGSRENLLGDNPSPALIQELSNELHVTRETPPCFIFHTYDDTAVPVENSLEFAAALRRNKVPFELHIYEQGAHGLGLGAKSADAAQMHPWTRECKRWLKERGFGK
jgi:acetyl esterase/lipase